MRASPASSRRPPPTSRRTHHAQYRTAVETMEAVYRDVRGGVARTDGGAPGEIDFYPREAGADELIDQFAIAGPRRVLRRAASARSSTSASRASTSGRAPSASTSPSRTPSGSGARCSRSCARGRRHDPGGDALTTRRVLRGPRRRRHRRDRRGVHRRRRLRPSGAGRPGLEFVRGRSALRAFFVRARGAVLSALRPLLAVDGPRCFVEGVPESMASHRRTSSSSARRSTATAGSRVTSP